MQLPATRPRGTGFRWFAIVPPILLGLLALGLCGGLFGVYQYESGLPTPTLITILPTDTPEPPATQEPTETPEPPTLTPTIPPSPTLAPTAPPTPIPPPDPPFPIVAMDFRADGLFGFKTTVGDPTLNTDNDKPLTYRKEETNNPADGRTNSIRVWVDGATPNFGSAEGTWTQPPGPNAERAGMEAAWQYQQIVFTEKVGVVVNPTNNRLGLYRIEFTAENVDGAPHDVGLRLMMDTLIGDNDGVPFVLPGQTGVITSPLDLRGGDVPASFTVFEPRDPNYPNIQDTDVIVQFTLGSEDATRPDRLLLSSWCRADWAWDYFDQVGGLGADFFQCQRKGNHDKKLDSAVGVFWDAKPLAPGETRSWVMYYGLGEYARPVPGSDLRLDTIKPQYNTGEQFYVTALIQNPKDGQSVRLDAPSEFEFMEGTPEQQITQVGLSFTQVSWRLRANQEITDATLIVTLLPGNTPPQTLTTTVKNLPTRTPTNTRVPTLTRIPTNTRTPTISPTPCATTVTQPRCP